MSDNGMTAEDFMLLCKKIANKIENASIDSSSWLKDEDCTKFITIVKYVIAEQNLDNTEEKTKKEED